MSEAACLDCVVKHLCQAMIIHEEEVPLGYPEHINRVIGHLGEASRESVLKYPELAGTLRDYRLKVMEEGAPMFIPPYLDMLAYVYILRYAEQADAELGIPDMPDNLKVVS